MARPDKKRRRERAARRDASGRAEPVGKGPRSRPAPQRRHAVPADRMRPWLLGATVALYVARPLFPSEGTSVQGDGLTAVMLWLALAVFWMLGAIGRPRFRACFGAVDAAVLLLVAWHSVAAVWAAVRVTPRPAVNMLWEWIGIGLGFFLARQFLTTRREARAVAAVMIALSMGLSSYGLYQVAVEMPQTRARYERNPDDALRDAGLWYPRGSPQREQFKARLDSPEPLATFALTNSLAGVLAPWLVVLVGIGVGGAARPTAQGRTPDPEGGDSSRQRNGRQAPVDESSRRQNEGQPSLDYWSRLRQRWFLSGWLAAGLCGLAITACLVLTRSRSAYVATALGLAAVFFLARRQCLRLGWKWPVAAAVALAVLVAAFATLGGFDLPVLSEAPKSLVYRLEYWRSTLAIIADYPVAGCGPGNFQGVYTAYKLPQASEEVADPHNFLLEIWATAGTPAMLALVAGLGLFFWRSWRTARAVADGDTYECEPGGSFATRGRADSPFAPDAGRDAAWFIYGGGAVGFALSVPLGQMSTAPPPLTALAVALPTAAVGAILLLGWVRQGRLPAVVPAIGVGVLLVHLLAAGGIGFPGVAGSLWLLVALGVFGDAPHAPGRSAALAGLAVLLALAFACYRTAYGPVVRARGAIRAAQSALSEGRIDRAERYLHAAAVADPWAATPLRELASINLGRWRQEHDPAALRRFEQYLDESLRRAPLSSSAWEAAGDWYFGVFEETRQREHLGQAVAKYRRAVELYPTRATGRAKLAIALGTAGEREEARSEAREALRLHQLTPHADKRLPDALHRQIMGLIGPRKGQP